MKVWASDSCFQVFCLLVLAHRILLGFVELGIHSEDVVGSIISRHKSCLLSKLTIVIGISKPIALQGAARVSGEGEAWAVRCSRMLRGGGFPKAFLVHNFYAKQDISTGLVGKCLANSDL